MVVVVGVVEAVVVVVPNVVTVVPGAVLEVAADVVVGDSESEVEVEVAPLPSEHAAIASAIMTANVRLLCAMSPHRGGRRNPVEATSRPVSARFMRTSLVLSESTSAGGR